jgi:parallel beta-helix repeat protein
MPRRLILICLTFIIVLSPSIGMRTYIVDDDGFANYKSISEAAAKANSGDTIYVKPGTYAGEVLLNKTLKIMPLTGETGQIVLKGDGSETGIKIVVDGCSIEGLTVTNFTKAGIEVESSGNTIKDNRFENDNPAVLVKGGAKNAISKNTMKNCTGGVALTQRSEDNDVLSNVIEGGVVAIMLRDGGSSSISNNIASATSGVWVWNSSNANIAGNTLTSDLAGIWVFNSSNCRSVDNILTGGNRGIYLMNCTSVQVSNSSIKDAEAGITLENASSSILQGCAIDNATVAIALGMSADNGIRQNSIMNNKDTVMMLIYSPHNQIEGNNISGSEIGIIISDSYGNLLRSNRMRDVQLGLHVAGSTPQSFNNTIGEDNLLAGKPIVYIYNQSGKEVKGRVLAHLTLAYCKDFLISENTISNDALYLFGSSGNKVLDNNVSRCYGMRLVGSNGNEIEGNTLNENRNSGLYLEISQFNEIRKNQARGNYQMGIALADCSANNLSGNTMDSNFESGIWLNVSNGNQIYDNNISNNSVGITLMKSQGNKIYHNNFLGNREQALDRQGNNIWDLGNVTGGNYWSDYKVSGNPSKGRSKIIKGAITMDRYPFQDPSGWMPDRSASSAASP